MMPTGMEIQIQSKAAEAVCPYVGRHMMDDGDASRGLSSCTVKIRRVKRGMSFHVKGQILSIQKMIGGDSDGTG